MWCTVVSRNEVEDGSVTHPKGYCDKGRVWAWNSGSIQLIINFGLEGLVYPFLTSRRRLSVTRAVFRAWNSSSIQLINYFGLEGLVESFQTFPSRLGFLAFLCQSLSPNRYVHDSADMRPRGIYLAVVHACAYMWVFLNDFQSSSSFGAGYVADAALSVWFG